MMTGNRKDQIWAHNTRHRKQSVTIRCLHDMSKPLHSHLHAVYIILIICYKSVVIFSAMWKCMWFLQWSSSTYIIDLKSDCLGCRRMLAMTWMSLLVRVTVNVPFTQHLWAVTLGLHASIYLNGEILKSQKRLATHNIFFFIKKIYI